MKSLAAEVVVESSASPEAIWCRVSDLTQMGRWSPECTGGLWLGPPSDSSVGSRFRGSNRKGLLRWSTTCTILAAEPGRLLTFDARHSSGACTRWTFTLTPNGRGTTVQEAFRTINSPAAILLVDRLAGRQRSLRSAMETTLQRLCADAERMVTSTSRSEQGGP